MEDNQQQTYTVSINVDQQYAAKINQTNIDGIYNEGDMCALTLESYDNENYIFKGWSIDGENIIWSEYDYKFTVTSSVTFILIFDANEISTYSVQIYAYSSQGTVTGSGEYKQGSNVTITATPNLGYSFIEWQEDNNQFNTSSSYIIKSIDRDYEIEAIFSEICLVENPKQLNYIINVNYRGSQLKIKWSPQMYSYTVAN